MAVQPPSKRNLKHNLSKCLFIPPDVCPGMIETASILRARFPSLKRTTVWHWLLQPYPISRLMDSSSADLWVGAENQCHW